ncbi:MAG TPA: purine-nucleoside phosphorylase [Streptosporangiaceae bacterium]|nr:purine-nucleoside phosphorylase [Streptosporangiaceae bacterium]
MTEDSPADDPYAAACASAAVLAAATGVDRHDVAVVLGSGWRAAADVVGETSAEVPLDALGGFPPTTVPGHVASVRSVVLRTGRALVFLGRVHLYEGHPPATVVHAVRMAVAAGCRVVVLTNAAGGICADYQVGQPVIVRDHLNLTGRSPLTGPPPPQPCASRFVDLTELYSPRLRALARQADPSLVEGVYAGLPGPHYETPAEILMLRSSGADLVGMSTVLEAIAARHLGAEVLAVSLVTNPAAGLAHGGLDHQEVVAAGQAATQRMGSLLARVLPACLGDGTA